MARIRTSNWDAIAAAVPSDQTAGRVVGQSQAEDEFAPPPGVFHSPDRPSLMAREEIRGPSDGEVSRARENYDKWVGLRIDRITIVGLDAGYRTSADKLRWVVRCDCGIYEHRKTRALGRAIAHAENGRAEEYACRACLQTGNVPVRHAKEGGQPVERAAAPEDPDAETLTAERAVTRRQLLLALRGVEAELARIRAMVERLSDS